MKKIVNYCESHPNSIQPSSRDAIRKIDEQHGVNKVTALMAACYGGHLKCVELLAKKSAFLEMKDRLGRTAAHFACMKGKHQVLVLLCGKFGACASTTDNNNKTLLDVCEMFISENTDLSDDLANMRMCFSVVETAKNMETSYNNMNELAAANANRRINDMNISLDTMQRELATAREVVSRVEGMDNNEGISVR